MNRALAAALVTALAACDLAACAHSTPDPGSTEYNLDVERARNAELLLNIVRAGRRRPLAFTTLQTITGTGVASESTFDIPIIQNHADMAFSLEQKLLGRGGPSFTVGVLETQEFYRGVLTPLTIQTFDLYLRRGLAEPLLMDLFFSEIDVAGQARPEEDGFLARFRNDPNDEGAFQDYQSFASLLIGAGLQTVAINRKEAGADFALCFQPQRPLRAHAERSCEALKARPSGDQTRGFELDMAQAPAGFCDLLNRNRARGAPLDCKAQSSISLSFIMRSPYDVLLYAGQTARQAMAGRPRLVAWGDGLAMPLFVVERGKAPKGAFSAVRYDGETYAIPSEVGREDQLGPTLQTVQVLTELMALNRSAKDLPASSVTVVTP